MVMGGVGWGYRLEYTVNKCKKQKSMGKNQRYLTQYDTI